MAQYLAKSQQDNMMYGMMLIMVIRLITHLMIMACTQADEVQVLFVVDIKMIKHYSRIIYVCAPIYIKG